MTFTDTGRKFTKEAKEKILRAISNYPHKWYDVWPLEVESSREFGTLPNYTWDIEEATMMSSQVLGSDLHTVMLDIDLPVTVLESSTPGHHHLFIDKKMDWSTYIDLLKALSRAGIIEEGYYHAALAQGATTIRMPWVRKDSVKI